MPDTSTTPRFVALDRAIIANAQAAFNQGDATAVEAALQHLGFARFMRAAPADLKAELQTTLAQAAENRRAARSKANPKPKAKPRPVRTTFARPTAQPVTSREHSEEAQGAAKLADNIRRNAAALNGNGKSGKAAEDPQAVWSRAIAANNPNLKK